MILTNQNIRTKVSKSQSLNSGQLTTGWVSSANQTNIQHQPNYAYWLQLRIPSATRALQLCGLRRYSLRHEHLLVAPVRVNVYRDKVLLLAKRPRRALRRRCVRRRLRQRLVERVERIYSNLRLRVRGVGAGAVALPRPARAIDVRQTTPRVRTGPARRVLRALELVTVAAGQALLAESQPRKGLAHRRVRADVYVSIPALWVVTVPAQEVHARGNTVRGGLV